MIPSPRNTKYSLESDFIIDLLNGKENAVSVYEEVKNDSLAITAVTAVTLFEILRGKEQNQDKIDSFAVLLGSGRRLSLKKGLSGVQ